LLPSYFSFVLKNLLNLPMHTARIPPVDPAPATITAAFAMHTGHMRPSSYTLVLGAHDMRLALNIEMLGVTSVAGIQNQQRAGLAWTR
jgi:hypothetical protein